MESETYSLVSKLSYIKNDAERDIINCLALHYVQHKNPSPGIDFLKLCDYMEARKHPTVETSDALTRLSVPGAIHIEWEYMDVDGKQQRIGKYSISQGIRNLVDEYFKNKSEPK